jgi:hypothetical protein
MGNHQPTRQFLPSCEFAGPMVHPFSHLRYLDAILDVPLRWHASKHNHASALPEGEVL